MIRAQIITHWVTTVEPDGRAHNDPDVFLAFPGIAYTDATDQPAENIPPSPNLFVAECVVPDATFAAILAHPDYGPGAVLWSETL